MVVSEDVSDWWVAVGGWVGGGPEPLLILEFSIQYHHLHICISTSDLDKVVGGLKQFRNWSKCGEFCCFTTRRKA